MTMKPAFMRATKVLGAAMIAFGLAAAGTAVAGTTNKNFHVNYQGGTVDVGHQTKAITGTAGYLRLSHNYPVGSKAKFRMSSGSTNWSWTPALEAGATAYLYNTATKGKDVRMDVTMNGGYGTTLKGYWRSN